MRIAAFLGALLALLGHWGNLGVFMRELAALTAPLVPKFVCFRALL